MLARVAEALHRTALKILLSRCNRLTGVSYIQRLNTVGGVAPTLPFDATKAGSKQLVKYQADLVFYKAP
ncbi:MAG: DUF3455 domain-containing protein [Herminiimonas sp.]|nr:DUF3455 domain-containing protein [Herminiimonas sp.]